MEERMQRLRGFIYGGDAAAVEAIMDEDVTITQQHMDVGYPALILAARLGHLGIVRLLLARGADVNALYLNILTALAEAAKGGHLDVVNLLLEHGARIRTSGPSSTLVAACRGGHLAVVERLIEHGGWQGKDIDDLGIDDLCLLATALRCSADILKAFLWAGLRCNDLSVRGFMDDAAKKGHKECANYLKWWWNEMRRAYLLNRAREKVGAKRVPYETYLTLKPVDMLLTIFHEAGDGDSESEAGGMKDDKETAGEMDAMLTYVVRDMPTELFTELMEGFKMPGQDLRSLSYLRPAKVLAAEGKDLMAEQCSYASDSGGSLGVGRLWACEDDSGDY